MLKILLIDDDPLLIEDMLTLYGYNVDTALDGFIGLQTLLKADKKYDLVILDVHMPKMDGWSVLKAIRSGTENSDIPVVMLTSADDEESMVSGLRRGADEYLTKPITPRKLFAHIDAIFRRIEWSSKMAVDKLHDEEDGGQSHLVELLTHRECEILKYIVRGYSNQQIGDKLVISETTVKNHLAHIYKKLNVANRTQAAFLAQKLKLI